jgi:RimJ/RimL family protein N-acetyltransferase
MTEVLTSLLDFSFDDLGLEKVRLILASDNYAAHRLARKCNFAREGDLRIEGKKRTGERFDLVAFGFTRVDYEGEAK